MKRSQTVNQFIADRKEWRTELGRLRTILQSTDLEENVKWGAPCYTMDGKNVVSIGSFKSYFGLWFFQGALLADEKNVLINAQEGKTKAMRQWRMNSATDIKPSVIKRYVNEAIKLVKDGRQIGPDRKKPVVVPTELKKAFGANKKAGAGFDKLRLGLQREYAEYVTDAKRAETKARRVEKILPMICAGIGLNDRYR